MDQPLRPSQQLTLVLRDAADERPGAAAAFFETLLRSSVFIPLKPIPEAGDQGLSELGGKGAGAGRFAFVDYMGNDCIPIFTEERFIEDWAEADFDSAEKDFRALIQLISDETWLYINPGQDVGKELTAWELARLRKGVDAIPELVAALDEAPVGEIEVRSEADAFPRLREKLLPIFQIYSELEEAFLVAVKEGGDEVERPMVGLMWRNANKAKKEYVRTEIENAVEEFLGDDGGTVFVIDDLEHKESPNHSLFSDAKPIYLNKAVKTDSRIAGLWQALGKKLKGD